jgi:hypothetical protein
MANKQTDHLPATAKDALLAQRNKRMEVYRRELDAQAALVGDLTLKMACSTDTNERAALGQDLAVARVKLDEIEADGRKVIDMFNTLEAERTAEIKKEELAAVDAKVRKIKTLMADRANVMAEFDKIAAQISAANDKLEKVNKEIGRHAHEFVDLHKPAKGYASSDYGIFLQHLRGESFDHCAPVQEVFRRAGLFTRGLIDPDHVWGRFDNVASVQAAAEHTAYRLCKSVDLKGILIKAAITGARITFDE